MDGLPRLVGVGGLESLTGPRDLPGLTGGSGPPSLTGPSGLESLSGPTGRGGLRSLTGGSGPPSWLARSDRSGRDSVGLAGPGAARRPAGQTMTGYRGGARTGGPGPAIRDRRQVRPAVSA